MDGISPIKISEDYSREKNFFQGKSALISKLVDAKIQCLGLSQIQRVSPLALLASTTSPHIVVNVAARIRLPSDFLSKKKGKKRSLANGVKPLHPIGISRCDAFPPLTSILQLLLFLPVVKEIVSFAPYSYRELSEFIEQYQKDKEKNLVVSKADPNTLLHLLKKKMEPYFFAGKSRQIKIRSFLCALIKTVFGEEPSATSLSLGGYLDQKISWDGVAPFSAAVDLPMRPNELFVEINGSLEVRAPVQRQFFTKPDRYCYDLDAFIEYRPDGKEEMGNYICYLKLSGGWYQCDDERITLIRSNYLNTPLGHCVLLHYKRVF